VLAHPNTRCDADPIALAKYIMALLKKNKPESDLRNTCLSQLEVFLNTETQSFVNVLFKTLAEKSYCDDVSAHTKNSCNETPSAAPLLPTPQPTAVDIHKSNVTSTALPSLSSVTRRYPTSTPNSADSSIKRNRSHTPDNGSSPSTVEARPYNDTKRVKNDALELKPTNGVRYKKRCRDYEERGYCMRGDTCLYDHGNDPVVLDPNTIAEPYNPEAPELEHTGHSFIPSTNATAAASTPPVYWPSSNTYASVGQRASVTAAANNNYRDNANMFKSGHHPQHHHHHQQHHHSQQLHNTNRAPGPFNSRKFWPSAPEFDSGDNRNKPLPPTLNPNASSFRPQLRRNTSNMPSSQSDFSARCSLEVRRIPSALNTISNLNDHFKRFGNLVNVQLCLDGDPESALVQFSSNQEALDAYRSTEAVLNNRFIRMFWHQPTSTPTETVETVPEVRVQAKPIPPPTTQTKESTGDDQSATNQLADVFAVTQKSTFTLPPQPPPTALLKKQYNSPLTPSSASSSSTESPKVETKIDPIAAKKEMLLKKLELQKKRQAIVASSMKQQKILLEKFSKSQNDQEKQEIRKCLQSLSQHIQSLEKMFQQDPPTPANKPKSKVQIGQEITDLENEIQIKMMKGEQVVNLYKRLDELKIQVRLSFFVLNS
jgi:RNA-binding protein 26